MAGMGYPSTWQDVLDENGERIPKRNKNGDIIRNKDGSIRYQQEPDKQGVIDWIEDQKAWLQTEMQRRYGWSREYKGSHSRGNLSIPDYKVARAEERRREIEQQINTMVLKVTRQLDDKISRLDESIDKIWKESEAWDTILKYLKSCSDEEYEEIFIKARKSLDRLPAQECEKAHLALDEIVKQASEKSGSGKTQLPAKQTIDIEK